MIANTGHTQCIEKPYSLSLLKRGPSGIIVVGDDILYIIQVTNTGLPVSGTVIQDYLPTGFALNYAVMATFPLQPTVNGSTLTWTLPHITGGQTINLFVYGHLTTA